MKLVSIFVSIVMAPFLSLPSSSSMAKGEQDLASFKSSSELVEALPDSAWRTLPPSNTLVMTLPSGEVIIELASQFAPNHVDNIKTLVQESYFDGVAVIRSQDNYVAQWGDTSDLAEDDASIKPKSIGSAKQRLEVEFFQPLDRIQFSEIRSRDAYADKVGFSDGMPVASDGELAWLSHCYGMVGVSRGNESNSGNGSGLYAVTGHSPRHLDLNVTLVGKVWVGMEHLSSLPRGKGPLGFYQNSENYVPIESIRFMNPARKIRVMRTDTPEFQRFVELRTTRNEKWFLRSTGKISLCNVNVPTR